MARRSNTRRLVRSVAYYQAKGDLKRAAEFAARLRALGRCVRCGRPLENPESVAAGVGPECRKVVA